ncbi:hypothetical protein BSR42_13730 [Megasphaera cerevisiae]|nr:hypothetical protein BSR42_13730 [Megasphaera cerevisiae]
MEYKSGLLSVVIVTFNQYKYLFETISSILMQNYFSIELIISDDGTKEFNIDEVYKFINKNKKENIFSISIFTREQNIGTVKNINYALDKVKGEYVKIIGGDDTFSHSSVFTEQVDLLLKNKEFFAVVGKAQQCDYKMNPISDERVEKSNIELPNILKMDAVLAKKYIYKKDIFPIAIQATCFRRIFFEKYGKCDEHYVVLDDSLTVLKMLDCYPNIGYVNDYCVNHRSKVGVSSSRELFSPRRILYYKDCVTYAEREIKNHPEIYGRIYCFEAPRINRYVLEMTKCKDKNLFFVFQVITSVCYIDVILYYSLTRTKKLIKRLREAK